MKTLNLIFNLLTIFLFNSSVRADLEQPLPEIHFNQKSGQSLPLDAVLINTNGEQVTLRDVITGVPLILGFGYNECPMLCDQQLQGLIEAIRTFEEKPGKDYTVAFVSIDPREPLDLTKEAEGNFRKAIAPAPPQSVGFFKADEENIERLTSAAGFGYTYLPEKDMYAHPAGWIVVTAEGVISAYEFGVRYDLKPFRDEIHNAQSSEIADAKPSLLIRCLQYNPLNGPYGNFIRRGLQVAALSTVLGIGFLVWKSEGKR